jgi:hypothetical protein
MAYIALTVSVDCFQQRATANCRQGLPVLSLRQVESSATSVVDTKLQHAIVIGTALDFVVVSLQK